MQNKIVSPKSLMLINMAFSGLLLCIILLTSLSIKNNNGLSISITSDFVFSFLKSLILIVIFFCLNRYGFKKQENKIRDMAFDKYENVFPVLAYLAFVANIILFIFVFIKLIGFGAFFLDSSQYKELLAELSAVSVLLGHIIEVATKESN